MTGMPLSSAFWIGLLKATGSTTETAMPLALPEIAVFIASTISETTDFSEPLHRPGSPATQPRACTLRAVTPRTLAHYPRETACVLACSPRVRIHDHSSITPVCSFPTTLPLPTLLYQYASVSRAPAWHYSGPSHWFHHRPILAVVPPST